jgi:hypothetical protein
MNAAGSQNLVLGLAAWGRLTHRVGAGRSTNQRDLWSAWGSTICGQTAALRKLSTRTHTHDRGDFSLPQDVTKLLFECTGFYASPYFRRDCVVRENDSKSRNGTPFPVITFTRSGLAPESDLSGLIKCCCAMTVGWPPIARKTVQTLVGVATVNLTRDCECGFALSDLKQAVNSKQEDLQHE